MNLWLQHIALRTIKVNTTILCIFTDQEVCGRKGQETQTTHHLYHPLWAGCPPPSTIQHQWSPPTLQPYVLHSLPSYTAVNSLLSKPYILMLPLTSCRAAQASNHHLNHPTILCSPFLIFLKNHSILEMCLLIYLSFPGIPCMPHCWPQTTLPQGHLSHPCLWGMMTPLSSTLTSFSDCTRISHSVKLGF